MADPKSIPQSLAAKVNRLVGLPLDQLRAAWAEEFRRTPPKSLSRDLLVRTLSWRLQEKVFGGHDRGTLRLLDACAGGKPAEVQLFRRLKPGSVVIREYQGIRHTVTITPDGFEWQGKTFSNLTAIARTITGSNWNGPRFFGLREKGKAVKEASA